MPPGCRPEDCYSPTAPAISRQIHSRPKPPDPSNRSHPGPEPRRRARQAHENSNGFLWRYFPRGISLHKSTEAMVVKVAEQLNNWLRKCLYYQTPAEVFNQALTGAFAIWIHHGPEWKVLCAPWESTLPVKPMQKPAFKIKKINAEWWYGFNRLVLFNDFNMCVYIHK